jgi:hypothetical protein
MLVLLPQLPFLLSSISFNTLFCPFAFPSPDHTKGSYDEAAGQLDSFFGDIRGRKRRICMDANT